MQVDGSFVPVVPAGVDIVDLDGEVILYDPASGGVHRLNAVGSVVWQCFDGKATVDELVADLAEGFGADPDVVRGDVSGLADALVSAGLLHDPDGSTAAEAASTPDETPAVLTNPPSP